MATSVPRNMNPLWIVSLFLGVSEVALATASTQTSGGIQVVYTAFAVSYPVLVTVCFFLVLWNRPQVLYAPRDFPAEVSPAAFTEAINSRRERVRTLELEVARRDAVTATTLEEAGATDLVERVREAQQESEVHIELADGNQLRQMSFTADANTTAQEFLNFIYFGIDDLVPPYSYGSTWQLRNEDSGTVYHGMGMKSKGGEDIAADRRTLAEVGIHPGMKLRVQLLKGSSNSRRRADALGTV
jgi:hypothetical protein